MRSVGICLVGLFCAIFLAIIVFNSSVSHLCGKQVRPCGGKQLPLCSFWDNNWSSLLFIESALFYLMYGGASIISIGLFFICMCLLTGKIQYI